MEYRLIGEPDLKPKPVSDELATIIDLANEELTRRRGNESRKVCVSAFEIEWAIGADKAQEAIVEAIDTLERVSFIAYGSWRSLFSKVSFDGRYLRLEYKPKAASVLKAIRR